MDSSPRSLANHFARLTDPRSPEKVRHKLLDLVILAVLAALAGADAWTEVEFFAEDQEDWLRTFLELPAGIPSHDTLGRVFSRIDAKAFTECFLSWVQAIRPVLPRDVVALDGKTLRRSFDTASEKSALHMVSAFSHGSGLVLGQRAVDSKSNEPDLSVSRWWRWSTFRVAVPAGFPCTPARLCDRPSAFGAAAGPGRCGAFRRLGLQPARRLPAHAGLRCWGARRTHWRRLWSRAALASLRAKARKRTRLGLTRVMT